jgi:polygalacturonase
VNAERIAARKRGCPPARLTAAILLLGSATCVFAFPPALPVIPPGITNITSFGAVGDGVTTNTAAIQNAINAASAAGIGTIEVPAGIFLSGPFTLKSSINLQLDVGAVLRLLPYTQYPGGAVNPADFISGSSLHDVEISGQGAIDGQGLPWWKVSETNSAANRPVLVNLSACSRVLIQDATFSNSPSMNLVLKGRAGNVTVQRVIMRAPASSAPGNPSHNTDAIDLAQTNCLIQNCDISVGDDNLAVGSSASASADILVTNCTFGAGHGVSIGSFTSGGVSNLTVVDCTFTNTDQGIRIKSDRDRGGVVQNLVYANLTMSNVQYPILIYCSYTNNISIYKSLNNITPAIAASYPPAPVTGKTPIYRNILISNVTATAQSSRMAGLIWGLPEMSITNVTLTNVNITGSKTLGVYYVQGLRMLDSRITVPGNIKAVSFFDAQITFSNSVPAINLVSLDGVSTNGIGNGLSFYNTGATLQPTNALYASPGLSLSGSTFWVSNHVNLAASTPVSFALGTNPSTISVSSNLTLNSTLNLVAGKGFGNGTYTLFEYGGSMTGQPLLGVTPAGYTCTLDTNTPQQVNVQVFAPAAPAITVPPADQTITAGSTANFQVLAGGSPPLTYQWQFKGATLNGATGSALTLASVQTNQAGGYDVIVSNFVGSVTSVMATLTVTIRPALLGWGDNSFGQCNPPPSVANATAISAGTWHCLAVRADGAVAAWGDDSAGECDVPPGLSNVIVVAAGGYHSLALRSDGSVAAWGENSYGQTSVPSNATNVAAIAAGDWYSLALRVDGTIVAWGSDQVGQLDIPPQATNIIAIAGGVEHCLALRADGAVLAWGSDVGPTGAFTGQAVVPSGLNQVVAIAAGGYHSQALLCSGTIAAWGDNSSAQTTVPPNITNAIAVAAGTFHSVALLANGTVAGWGSDLQGQISFDPGLQNITAIAAGGSFSLTLAGQVPPGLRLPTPVRNGKNLILPLSTERGRDYFLQYKNSASDGNWLWSFGLLGNGGQKSFADSITNAAQKFYRVRRQ